MYFLTYEFVLLAYASSTLYPLISVMRQGIEMYLHEEIAVRDKHLVLELIIQSPMILIIIYQTFCIFSCTLFGYKKKHVLVLYYTTISSLSAYLLTYIQIDIVIGAKLVKNMKTK